MEGTDLVEVRRETAYQTGEAAPLTMDLYYPPHRKQNETLPAVVIVAGYPDSGFAKMMGCKFKDMGSSVSWAELAAASGMVGITYENREPTADLHRLFEHLTESGASHGIDSSRIGVWASSGHVPLALSLLMPHKAQQVRCAALLYGYTVDIDGEAVSQAAKSFGFANPCAGKSVDDLAKHVPLFVVRAGQDQLPGLNQALDRFVLNALSANLPLTVVNHPTAPHAFDLLDDTEASREVVRRVLEFLRFHLSGVS
jgi:hypothetical protein